MPLLRLVRQAGAALALIGALASLSSSSFAQGCVAAHGSGVPKALDLTETSNSWDLSIAHRWFTSDKHYVGTAFQAQRDTAGDQVINHSKFTDLTVDYTINPRYSASLTIPYVSHDRSQAIKDASGKIIDRASTQASGLADISINGAAWLLDPATSMKGNLQLGLGLSLPTGDSNVKDVFETFDRTSGKILGVRKNVDQSIQPGIGGYGIIVGLSGYRVLGAGFTGYLNGSYTITPQEMNGTQTGRGSVYEAVESIPDTYLGRIGVEYAVPGSSGVSLSLGFRAEGVTVYDLVGGSNGFRRPGYSVALEPGVGYAGKRWGAHLYVPIAIQRDRLQSYADKQRTWATGTYSQGDAAFAQYLVAISLTYKL